MKSLSLPVIGNGRRPAGLLPLHALLHKAPFLRAVLVVGIITLAGTYAPGSGDETTRLPSLFSDNMVLQRDATVNIWGRDKPHTDIDLASSWGANATATSDDAGYWRTTLQTTGAVGPQQLTIKGTDTIRLDNILLGEVWVCSGQSNMEMPMKGFNGQPVVDSQEEVLQADKPKLRYFIVERNQSDVPLADVAGEWIVCCPESIREFSAVGYFFGDKLLEQLDVPVGLIGSYWGGTLIEAWTDRTTLEKSFSDPEISRQPGDKPGPGELYNGMIHPIIPYTIKGAIWYQGESNRHKPGVYSRLLKTLVDDWRLKWNQGNFPFYYVQIAPYQYDGCEAVGTALLREAQLKASFLIENSGMVVSLDHGNCGSIHPFNKRPIGERLAYWALKCQYGFDFLQTAGPVLREMRSEGNQAILSFDNAPNGLIFRYAHLDEFEIADNSKIFYRATAQVNHDGTLTVSAPEVTQPVAVRYAFRNCPKASLFNTEGLPASSFRTDDW